MIKKFYGKCTVFTVCLLCSRIYAGGRERNKNGLFNILVPENLLYAIIPPPIFQFQNAISKLSTLLLIPPPQIKSITYAIILTKKSHVIACPLFLVGLSRMTER